MSLFVYGVLIRELDITLADGSVTTALAYCYASEVPAHAVPILGGGFGDWLKESGREAIVERGSLPG